MDLALREVIALEPSRLAPAQAREAVRRFAGSSVADDVTSTAELLASELVTNAVVHGLGGITLTMQYDEHGLAVTVHDDEPSPPVIPAPHPLSLGGRGLRLVDGFASAWGVTPDVDGAGKGVWFRLA